MLLRERTFRDDGALALSEPERRTGQRRCPGDAGEQPEHYAPSQTLRHRANHKSGGDGAKVAGGVAAVISEDGPLAHFGNTVRRR